MKKMKTIIIRGKKYLMINDCLLSCEKLNKINKQIIELSKNLKEMK